MTALDLSTATRSLTIPSAAFTSTPFGDATMAPTSGVAVNVGTYNGHPAIIPTATATLRTTATVAGNGNSAIFVAVANMQDIYTPLYSHGSALAFTVDLDEFRAVASSTYLGGSTATTLATLPTPYTAGDFAVWCIISNSSGAAFINNVDGVLGTTATAQTTPATAVIQTLLKVDQYLLGIWQFNDVTLSTADAIDTIAAIEASFAPSSDPIGASGWGIAATGSVDVGELDAPPIPTAPTPGGTKTPPADPEPADESTMRAAGKYPIRHVWETMPAPTVVDGRPIAWEATSEGNSEYGYLQIIVEGTDISLYDGIPTPFPSWRRAEPFGAQSATIELPQITMFHSIPSWARHGANVHIRFAKLSGEKVSLWHGFVMDVGIREDSGTFTLEAMGILYGADLTIRTPSLTTTPRDIGSLIPALLNAVSSRRWLSTAKVVTGIKTSVSGGWEPLLTSYIQELLATALDSSSRQWTVSCVNRTPVLERKDTTTIAATVRAGQRGIAIDLNSDASMTPNVIYGEGTNPDGGSWRNAMYPNWRDDDTPDYPNTSASDTMKVGRTDASTDSGDGISLIEAKLGLPVNGYYSQSDKQAVMRAQRRLGILVDGIIGPQTWAAVFDTGANTGSLDGAFIAPLAYVDAVMPRLYGPDGDDQGANPDFDEDIVRVETKVSYGQGVWKSTAVRHAERQLKRDSEPGWYGLVSFTLDPSEKSKYELREGENLSILGWHGEDLTAHISSARYDESVVALEVDTKARDYPTLQALMTRDRDAVDPAKTAARRLLAGQVESDRPTYDAESPAGKIPRQALYTNLWNVRRVPMGAYGTVSRSQFKTTSSATPFAVAVFGKDLTAAQLSAVVGNPLAAASNPWTDHADALEDMGMLQSWGWNSQPCGYYPGTYSDPDGATGAAVTGRMVDDASWDYASSSSPWLWVAMIASSACYIEGRLYGSAS